MPAKKLPRTDEGRIIALQKIIDQDELIGSEEAILSVSEFHETRNLLLNFEGATFCFKQAKEDEQRADKSYIDLFKTAQLYISHFIQVLNLAIIRKEIKAENLSFYRLENSNEFSVPDLSSEDAVIEWGKRVIEGETNRTANGGAPIYNPAISKVKVHYDLFNEALYSLKIYRQNTIRTQEQLTDAREQIDRIIWNTWTKAEFKYWGLSPEERKNMFDAYGIEFHHQGGVQLSVFG